MNRKEFIKIINCLSKIRDFLFKFGLFFFGSFGYFLAHISIIFYLSEKGYEIPNILNWLFVGFTYWISFCLSISLISIILYGILINKNNWRKNG